MKKKLFAILLLAGTSMFAAPRFYFGVGVGYYPHRVYVGPPPVRYYAPVVRTYAPGPEYVWIDGYHYPVGASYAWREGYWARRPFVGARWVAPRYYGHYYYHGYWRR